MTQTSFASDAGKSVAILLGTYNGAAYLAEQLDSFLAQTHTNWHIYVSDDGSSDATLAMLEEYRAKTGGRLTIYAGPRKGFAENFLSLVCRGEIQADYYAYSDQDDIWLADKLARAVAWHESVDGHKPALYGSTTLLVDAQNNEIGETFLFRKPFGFRNAIIQNIASGNTMVFNNATRRLLVEVGNNIHVVAHDWWTYILTSACGGAVHVDPKPSLRYRQHGNNLIGSNMGVMAKWARACGMLKGQLHVWGNSHVAALEKIKQHFTAENLSVYELYKNAREKSFFPRVLGINRSGIYRQTMLGNMGLIVAILLGKI